MKGNESKEGCAGGHAAYQENEGNRPEFSHGLSPSDNSIRNGRKGDQHSCGHKAEKTANGGSPPQYRIILLGDSGSSMSEKSSHPNRGREKPRRRRKLDYEGVDEHALTVLGPHAHVARQSRQI